MGKPSDLSERWRELDDSPSEMIAMMDAINALPWVRSNKRLALDMLALAQGDHVLDLACGTGDEVRAVSARIGPTGRAVGLDGSQSMIEEARRRSRGSTPEPEFLVGDAHALPFGDAVFDACCSFGSFEILRDPDAALAEAARITRPAGRIVISAPDIGTWIVDSSDERLTRRMADYFHSLGNGSIGRRLPGLFAELDLREVVVRPDTVVMRDYEQARIWLEPVARGAADHGVVSSEEADTWLHALRARSEAGRFFASLTLFVTLGRK